MTGPSRAVAAQLGVAWHTIMTQVSDRGKPLVEDPDRLGGVSAIGVDETAFLRATGTHPTLYATGIADLTAGRTPRLLDVTQGRSGPCWATGSPPETNRGEQGSRPRRWTRSVATPPR